MAAPRGPKGVENRETRNYLYLNCFILLGHTRVPQDLTVNWLHKEHDGYICMVVT